MRFIKDSTKVFLSQFTRFFFGFLTSIIIARTLGTTGKGIFEIVKLIPWFGSLFIAFGMEEATAYYVSKYPEKRKKILTNILYFSILLGIIFVIILISKTKWFISHPLRNLNEKFFILGTICIPAFTITRCAIAYFQGLKDFNLYFLSNISVAFFTFLLVSIFAKRGINFAIISLSSAFFLSGILNLILLSIKIKPVLFPDFKLLLQMLSYGIRAQVGVLIRFINLRADNFILNYFAGASAVGIYSVSVSLAEMLWHLPGAFATSLLPRVASSSDEEIRNYTEKTMGGVILILFIGIFLLVIAGKFLINLLWGKPFLGSYSPMLWLFPGVIAISIAKISSSVFHGKGHPEYGSLLSVISCFTMLPLDFVLIPKYGVVGAAIASSISYTLTGVVAVLILRRLITIKVINMFKINYKKVLSFLELK